MPHIISRQEAIRKIKKEIPKGSCLVCTILKKPHEFILYKGKHTAILLSAYPRCWGQVMVIVNRHITSFSKLKESEWKELMHGVQLSTKAVEKVLKPVRCYVAATGAYKNMIMTSPHLHFNIIPVYDKTSKPSEIFTWEQGIYSGTNKEWNDLYKKLKKAMK